MTYRINRTKYDVTLSSKHLLMVIQYLRVEKSWYK